MKTTLYELQREKNKYEGTTLADCPSLSLGQFERLKHNELESIARAVIIVAEDSSQLTPEHQELVEWAKNFK